MNPALEKIWKDFNDEIQKIRGEIQNMRDTALHKPDSSNSTQAMYTSQINSGLINIVIRNFPEGANKDKVNSLLKDVLKVNISIESAERKEKKSDTENGVIIAVCKSRDDKDTLMKSKSKLRLSNAYSSVYIENDMTRKERNSISNLRTLAHVIGKDKVYERGNKLLVRDQTDQRTNTGGDWQGVTYRRDKQPTDNRRCNTPATLQYRSSGHRDTYAARTSDNGYRKHGREQGGGDRDHRHNSYNLRDIDIENSSRGMTTINHVTTADRTFQDTISTGTRFHAGFGIVTVLTKMKNQIVIK
ncbi:hypothetical protein DPMN_004502 [Dreissena polymorpha]|uniref:Uncharacterized protein n=1 Tax=Dreissena polymorpha TaxID=45954 RepID=A0A9D4MQX5_DREPO|nr:hypothetical protein DPMN_004502 [Dreissena polymorpha]